MLISTLPDEILDLTFKQLVPPFRSDALTEVYVFDTPVHLLRLRLVSKRFCRIATPLAWRRVQLRISGEEIAETVLKDRSWWSAPSLSTSQDNGTISPIHFKESPEEDFSRPSPFSSSSYQAISNGRCLNSNPTISHCPPSSSLQFLFFQGRPKLAAHVRVLSLIISVEHQIEGSGSGSGSGPAFEFVSESGLVSAPGDFSFAWHGDNESEFGSASGSHRRNNAPSSSLTMTTAAQRSFPSSNPSSTWCLEYVLRAATKGMSNLRTVFVWDAATPTVTSFSPQAGVAPSCTTTGETLAQEVISLFHRSRLLKVLSLRDVDGAAFSAKNDCHDDYSRQVVAGCSPMILARPERQSYQGLKMLHLSNAQHPARIISSVAATSTLEVLSLEVVGSTNDSVSGRNGSTDLVPTPTLRDLPWSTLKEVSLLHCADDEDWCHFLGGFQSLQSQNLQSTLTELLIGDLSGLDQSLSNTHHAHGTGTRLTHLLITFQLQPLTKLTLFTLPHLTPLTTSRIVHAFPNLRSLTILTENEFAPWQSGTLDDYARIFGMLPHLETLGWNNSHLLQPCSQADFESSHNMAACYARSVTALVKRAKRLKCVKFISAADCLVDSVFITKKKNKSHFRNGPLLPYEHCGPQTGPSQPEQHRLMLTVKRSNKAALHTSSWDTTSVRFDDI